MDTKVVFPTQTLHLQKPKQLSPLEHESCREVIESLTSENAKLKEDIDTLQTEKEKLGLSRTPLSKVLQFRKEIKNLKKLNKVLNKRIQQKKYNSSFHSTTKQKTNGKNNKTYG